MNAPRSTRPGRSSRSVLAGAAVAATLVLSGCSMGTDLYRTTLPGGADVGDDPITVTAAFEDVVDLVPQSSVKVENIAVGRVKSIDLAQDGRSARVELLVRRDLSLPTGTTARLQQTSLLGEKYVALIRPETGAEGEGELTNGSDIPLGDTSQQAEVEQVLGALSLVVNGGGVAKFQEISRELKDVSSGRPEEIRAFLRNMNTFVTTMDQNKASITAALDSMARLSTTLDGDKAKIAKALEELSPGMRVLVDQRQDLVKMLSAMDRLSTVSIRTLDAAQKDMVEDMNLLEPILDQLAESGAALPNSLELLLTYPFPDSVLGAIKGDYFNVFATANYTSLPANCQGFGCPWPQIGDGLYPAEAYRGDPSVVDRVTAEPMGTASSTPGATRSATPSSPASGSEPPSPAPPTDSDSPGVAQSPTDGAAATPHPPASGSPSQTPTSSPTIDPSPSLLPPTDSALPGVPGRSVQVPVASRTRQES